MLRFIWKFLCNLFSRLFSSSRAVANEGVDGYKTIILQRVGGVVKLTLNRARKKNAFNVVMYREVTKALTELSADETVKVCVITGAGDFYSSGNDLSNFSRLVHPLTMAKQARDLLQQFVDPFITCSKPLVAYVNGPAIGIAATTLGLCDRVYAHERAYFKTPFAELGQYPEACSSFMFPRIMGEEKANTVLWGGKVLDAQDAKTCGLVHRVISAADAEATASGTDDANASLLLPAEVVEHCKYLASLPTNDPAAQRSIVKQGLIEKLKSVNAEECSILQRKWVSKECFNALAEFLEKKNMKLAANMLRFANFTGPLWGQPE